MYFDILQPSIGDLLKHF